MELTWTCEVLALCVAAECLEWSCSELSCEGNVKDTPDFQSLAHKVKHLINMFLYWLQVEMINFLLIGLN